VLPEIAHSGRSRDRLPVGNDWIGEVAWQWQLNAKGSLKRAMDFLDYKLWLVAV
jgi:hypothetical protein